MSLKYAILGFLQNQHLTGYDLKKTFDRSIQFFWPANQSQIYRTLADLSKDGLVEHDNISREDLLDMKIYHITEAGRADLERWLAEPISVPPYRDASLIQLYFGASLSDEQVHQLLKQTRQESVASYEQLLGMYALYSELFLSHPQPRSLFYNMLTIEFGLSNIRASIAWIDSVLNRLEHRQLQPLPQELFSITSLEK